MACRFWSRYAGHSDRLRELHAEGFSAPQIAKKLRIPRSAAYTLRKALGLKPVPLSGRPPKEVPPCPRCGRAGRVAKGGVNPTRCDATKFAGPEEVCMDCYMAYRQAWFKGKQVGAFRATPRPKLRPSPAVTAPTPPPAPTAPRCCDCGTTGGNVLPGRPAPSRLPVAEFGGPPGGACLRCWSDWRRWKEGQVAKAPAPLELTPDVVALLEAQKRERVQDARRILAWYTVAMAAREGIPRQEARAIVRQRIACGSIVLPAVVSRAQAG